MPDFEQHGWQGFWIPGRRCMGQHGVAIIIKRRFEVDMMDATCRPAVTPPVALMAEDFDDGEPPMVSVKRPMEMAIEKPNVDIIVSATAYAPGGKPVPQFDVEIRIPRVLQRKLRIYGNRHLIWYPPLKWLTKEDMLKGEQWVWPDPDFSEPEPIDKLALRYEHAYGGWAKIILNDDAKEMAEEAQEKSAVIEERRKKKKEIEAKLKKEEEDAKKKEADKKKPKPKGVSDDKAAQIAEKAFLIDEGVDLKLDDETRKKLADKDASDDGMKIVSAYRLGQHMGERPEEDEGGEGEAEGDEGKKGDAEGEKKGDAKKKPKSDVDDFFTSEKTSALDLNKLMEKDEFKELLDDRAVGEARKLKDEEGTLRDRATEFGDIKLTDDNWASAYVRARPEKKKRKMEETETPQMPYPANMVGKGFVVSHLEEAIENVPLPNIEDPEDLLKNEDYVTDLAQFDLKKLRTPAGWAPYPMAWYPRAQHWGVYFWDIDKAKAGLDMAKEEFDPDDPDDKVALEQLGKFEFPIMNALAFQEAHPKMQVKEIRGDEEVYLTNVTPTGTLFFRLPGVHPTVTVDMSKGPVPLRMRLDTLLIDVDDPEKPAVEMLWRGWVPLKSFKDLEVTPLKKVNIIETDQEGWNKLQVKQAKGETGLSEDGLTKTVKAITDDELDAMGEDADKKYQEQFKRKRDGFGAKIDETSDAFVFDQDQDRQLYKDDWDASIREEKDAFVEAEKKKADELQKIKDKVFKAKARDLADEEFGIIRDPDTGEVLAVEPPDKGGGKKKGK